MKLEDVLANPAAFFSTLRSGKFLGPRLDEGEVSGCSAIAIACAGLPLSYPADMLGTAYLETASTMQPVKEANWLSEDAANRYFFRMYDIGGARPAKARELGNLAPGDGAKYCGRGYPQMTGKANYAKATTKLRALGFDVDLIKNPDDAMRPDVAAAIMRYGMVEGWFTTKRLVDYLPSSGPARAEQFRQSRRIINGTDRANDLAVYCMHFQQALIAGGWKA